MSAEDMVKGALLGHLDEHLQHPQDRRLSQRIANARIARA